MAKKLWDKGYEINDVLEAYTTGDDWRLDAALIKWDCAGSMAHATMLAKAPEYVVSEAIRRMLPKSKLARVMLTKLKVYASSEHPHKAQQPEVMEL